MNHQAVKQYISTYYSQKIQAHGATYQGVNWNSQESQWLRFEQLFRGFPSAPDKTITLNDYGCGYGALIDYLESLQVDFQYTGYDLGLEMIQAAKESHASEPQIRFVTGDQLESANYTAASGIFNVRLTHYISNWEQSISNCLRKTDKANQYGFSFNILTLYSDPVRQREDLYYANPTFWFGFCKREFSRNVTLFHDYDLYEFTISVLKLSGQ